MQLKTHFLIRRILWVLAVWLASPMGRGEISEELRSAIRQHIQKADQHSDELKAPEFPPSRTWFNSPPLSLQRELKGKVVVLDFWTYCCINCIHILPDLAGLERKYAGYPVAFVGVHSAKFENEKLDQNILQAVLRYEIEHPVINDDEMIMWRGLGVRSWPSMAVIGPKGNLLLMVSGEGKKDLIDACISETLNFYSPDLFRHDPVPMELERDKPAHTQDEQPLRFPGKLAMDPDQQTLYISDSNHNRILVTSSEGHFLHAIGNGRVGLVDGDYASARFNRPQGIAWHNGRLYVADAENHALREIDPTTHMVKTLAGNGKQGRDYRGGTRGSDQPLSTPWDVVGYRDSILIAMAGTHQIWKWDILQQAASQISGDGSEQNLNSTKADEVAWAQPSGLSVMHQSLMVADSESSTIRALDLQNYTSRPLVGGDSNEPRNLFDFGDRDGIGDEAALQHPLGVLFHPSTGSILVADTYNHKIKILNLSQRQISTLAGTGVAGYQDGPFSQAQFSEPSGFAFHPARPLVYVADTNNHRIRILNMEARLVSTMVLTGIPEALEPYAPGVFSLAGFPVHEQKSAPAVLALPPDQNQSTSVTLLFQLPDGCKYNELAPSNGRSNSPHHQIRIGSVLNTENYLRTTLK
ncbi:MAG: hypothetical protein LR011_07055 [Verrucomicrobia bacterium]|nr:hypothetical protein [Verrucomicrobiota bacterium]